VEIDTVRCRSAARILAGGVWLEITRRCQFACQHCYVESGQHTVYRVSSAKAADLRRFRATDRLTRQAAEHKTRIRDLVRQLLPISPLRGELGRDDLAVLTRTGGRHPGLLVEMGPSLLTELICEASVGHLGAERGSRWLDAARGALALYGDHPAFAADALADEMQTEIRLLAPIEKELSAHATPREAAYRQVDPRALARFLSSVAKWRAGTGGADGAPRPLPHRRPLPLLHRADAQDVGDG
jgi:hypothetical protein